MRKKVLEQLDLLQRLEWVFDYEEAREVLNKGSLNSRNDEKAEKYHQELLDLKKQYNEITEKNLGIIKKVKKGKWNEDVFNDARRNWKEIEGRLDIAGFKGNEKFEKIKEIMSSQNGYSEMENAVKEIIKQIQTFIEKGYSKEISTLRKKKEWEELEWYQKNPFVWNELKEAKKDVESIKVKSNAEKTHSSSNRKEGNEENNIIVKRSENYSIAIIPKQYNMYEIRGTVKNKDYEWKGKGRSRYIDNLGEDMKENKIIGDLTIVKEGLVLGTAVRDVKGETRNFEKELLKCVFKLLDENIKFNGK